uniref:Uncharacterized protein LOC104266565 n=1 Tax=Phallusia mammillata TaxID=59560 RepID=A0A6F9DIE4_9ASCI|nr:uncharacterized protein LOC104266565 [Phallusia mammillata]
MCSNLELSAEVVSMLQKQNDFLFEQIQKLRKESVKLHQLIQVHQWGHKLFAKDNETLEYLTGCPSYAVFASMTQSLTADCATHRRLSPANQLFLTLMKVKLYLPHAYLKALFRGINVEETLNIWLPLLEETLSQLLVWPSPRIRTDFIVSFFNLQFTLQVAVVFTTKGSICYVTEALPAGRLSLFEDQEFLGQINHGDRVLVVQTGFIHKATKQMNVIKFHLTGKKSKDVAAFNLAEKAITNTLTRLGTFAIFSQGVDEFRHMNALVKISAALVNLYQQNEDSDSL